MPRTHHHSHHNIATFIHIAMLFLLISHHGTSLSYYKYIYSGCSQEKYAPGSPFEANLNSFLTTAVAESSTYSYSNFSTDQGILYGLYQCKGDLGLSDCSNCMRNAVSQIAVRCPYSYGASLQLEGCFIRYEQVNFLGTDDTNLRYKVCGMSVRDDAQFLREKDSVLMGLENESGFSTRSLGSVIGYVQCLGDLRANDCSSCIKVAVGLIKSLCGSSVWGDVFLGQCSVHFTDAQYLDQSSGSSNMDNMGKTISITIGALAGVAIMIVILASCCRGTTSK